MLFQKNIVNFVPDFQCLRFIMTFNRRVLSESSIKRGLLAPILMMGIMLVKRREGRGRESLYMGKAFTLALCS